MKVSIATKPFTADVPEAVMAREVLARRGEILWRVFIFATGSPARGRDGAAQSFTNLLTCLFQFGSNDATFGKM
jgi:hypothetical protein